MIRKLSRRGILLRNLSSRSFRRTRSQRKVINGEKRVTFDLPDDASVATSYGTDESIQLFDGDEDMFFDDFESEFESSQGFGLDYDHYFLKEEDEEDHDEDSDSEQKGFQLPFGESGSQQKSRKGKGNEKSFLEEGSESFRGGIFLQDDGHFLLEPENAQEDDEANASTASHRADDKQTKNTMKKNEKCFLEQGSESFRGGLCFDFENDDSDEDEELRI